MVEVKIVQSIDEEKWDNFVKEHPYGWICHLSGWKRTLNESFKHIKPYFILITENEAIKSAIPIYKVDSFITGKRLVSIPFATLSDPLVNTQEDMNAILNEIIKLKNRISTSYIEIRCLQSRFLNYNGDFLKDLTYKHHYLFLDKNIEEIKKSFHRSCVRQRISRAEKSGLTIREGENYEDLRIFYDLYLLTRKRLLLPPQPFKFFIALWNNFWPGKRIQLLFAEKNRKPLASLLLFKFKKRVSAEYIGYDNTYNELSANHFLFWHAIRCAWSEGYEVFDFGRTSKRNGSLMDFKNRWGTNDIDLPIFYYPKNIGMKSCNKENFWGYKLVQRLCKRASPNLLENMGKYIYRHMG